MIGGGGGGGGEYLHWTVIADLPWKYEIKNSRKGQKKGPREGRKLGKWKRKKKCSRKLNAERREFDLLTTPLCPKMTILVFFWLLSFK